MQDDFYLELPKQRRLCIKQQGIEKRWTTLDPPEERHVQVWSASRGETQGEVSEGGVNDLMTFVGCFTYLVLFLGVFSRVNPSFHLVFANFR